MKINRIYSVYFSPCGHTEKITLELALDIGRQLGIKVEKLDYTLPNTRNNKYVFDKEDLIIWGSPVYAGRIPNKILPFIEDNFNGNGALAVPVVVFGNRNFDDALVELKNLLENNGFHTIGGAAVPAKHAFSNIIAHNRPDERDLKDINEFSKDVIKKIKSLNEVTNPVFVKGENPPVKYYTPKGLDGSPTIFLKAKPKTDLKKCILCKVCASKCPVGSINEENPSEILGICIKCHSCVNRCPNNAKYFDDEAFLSHKAMLERDFLERKEPEFFL